MIRTPTELTTAVKDTTITLGLYKPARWLIDHVIDRDRVGAHARRLSLYRSLLSPDALCYDVGANIGDYAETLGRACARVIAIEPQPSCLRELRARFRGDSRITVVPVALGAEQGSAEFYLRGNRGSSGFIEEWDNRKNIGSLPVPIQTLDELIATYGLPDYIKMDVEGVELEVVKGLSKKIALMSFEYHLTADDCASKLQMIDLLGRFGRLEFNILPEGANHLYWREFVSPTEFFDMFPKKVEERTHEFMGDIFVRTT